MGFRGCAIAVLAALVAAPAAMADEVPAPRGSTPALIGQAADRGAIDRDTATLYLAYAVKGDGRLPRAYRSSVPWHATFVLRELHRRVRAMKPGARRERAEDAVTPAAVGSNCDTSVSTSPDSTQSEHFYIEYDPATLGELDIDAYKESLEDAWSTEVEAFGWAAPPVAPNPAPGGKYHVILDPTLGPQGIYGFVAGQGTHAGQVGNNPATAWDDQDAYATCMVLASDYSGFPSGAQASLDATTAHEFNHSLQAGIGAIFDASEPDLSFTEGMATAMEDEVQDGADDNYGFLWPDFDFSMGEYGDDDPYPYWITFRGLTERFGAGAPGGAEQVMQDFWELNSKDDSHQLVALNKALDATQAGPGPTLAAAYHAYAVAVKFNKSCGGGYVYPYCLEEGPGYVGVAGPSDPHASIAAVGGSVTRDLEDNYALNWVTLPTAGGPYSVTLTSPGQMRGSVACDTSTAIQVTPLPATSFDPGSCTGAPVAVVTNERQTADNPTTFEARSYTLATAAPTSGGGPPPGGGAGGGTTGGAAGDQGSTGTPTTGSGAEPRSVPAPRDTKPPVVKVKVSSRRALRTLLRKGLLIRVRTSEKATARAELLLGRRTFSRLARAAKSRRIVIGRRAARFAAPGSRRVRIRLSRRAKRVLRRARRLRLLLRVRVTDAAGNRHTARGRISVRR